MTPKKALHRRLELLESHLRAEHPHLLPVIPTFRAFDRLLYRMGLLGGAESLATRIPWWPVISVLGLFSAGKSSFLNSYLGTELQASGNQAIDDKFTVVCYGPDRRYDALPGTALNADPRFPFYRMSDEIEKVAAGEGKRIDGYLQLKTCSSPRLKGKILIDSPGFDADDQRRSTLRVTDHIIDLADLVLVFFDARRPEPGSMTDTLTHLVSKTVLRTDARKFLYILNQIDTSAREDNPEEIVGAWQRSIAQAGLISGKFYGIYNKDVAPPIEDPTKRARYEAKCDEDLAEIHSRITEVEFGRGYRIVGILDALAKELEGEVVPYLKGLIGKWRRQVLIRDAIAVVVIAAAAGGIGYLAGAETLNNWGTWLTGAKPDWLDGWPVRLVAVGALAAAGLLALHFMFRAMVARTIAAALPERMGQMDLNARLAFRRNTSIFRSLFQTTPAGWNGGTRRRIFGIRETIGRHVQVWNDLYTDPAGAKQAAVPAVGRQSGGAGGYRQPATGYRQSGAEPAAPLDPPRATIEGEEAVSTTPPAATTAPGGLKVGDLIGRLKSLAWSR
ncbi:MAG: hypothetical protein GC168_18600 [Candidatus Hydrogenedens sp.]|nr:hypothetical protein [Candidatus Hydrogenedens sp.]